MARPLRHDFPGAWHHVMHRGARAQPIFADDDDCLIFLDVLAEAVEKRGLQVHAYALMPNHYHLLVRTAAGTLSRAMQFVNAAYTQRINRKHGWDGAVFRGRFHSRLVDDETYLKQVLAYIHLNPVKANLVMRVDAEAWTSHRAYLGTDPAPDWLTCGALLDAFGGRGPLRTFVRELHVGRRAWVQAIREDRGWYDRSTPNTAVAVLPAAAPPVPRWTAAEVLQRVSRLTGASLADLRTVARGPRANPARRFAVWALRRNTDATAEVIGEHLEMALRQVHNLSQRVARSPAPGLEAWMEAWRADEADIVT